MCDQAELCCGGFICLRMKGGRRRQTRQYVRHNCFSFEQLHVSSFMQTGRQPRAAIRRHEMHHFFTILHLQSNNTANESLFESELERNGETSDSGSDSHPVDRTQSEQANASTKIETGRVCFEKPFATLIFLRFEENEKLPEFFRCGP